MLNISKILRPSPFFLAVFLMLSSCYEEHIIPEIISVYNEQSIIKFNDKPGILEKNSSKIYFTIGSDTIPSFSPKVEFSQYTSFSFNEQELIDKEIIPLGEVVTNKSYQLIASKGSNTDTFEIEFTSLPIMHVVTNNEIVNEPKVLSKIYFQYNNPDKDPHIIHQLETFAGIEIRGNFSQSYEKKSFGIEFWLNENKKDYPMPLMNMRPSADWALDAMSIDKLRMRNKISNKVWQNISSLPKVDEWHNTFPGIECQYVEVFINNEYQGLYCLGERLDANVLNYNNYQYQVGGVLYKGISWGGFSNWENEPSDDFIWDKAWEQIYPKHDTAWNRLYQLRDFMINSDNSTFCDHIEQNLDFNNLVDYYLFINLVSAYDNTGKNLFVASYTDDSPFFILPWDIECSWGIMWPGDRVWSEGTITMDLFKRLIETNAKYYNLALKQRWAELRPTYFNEEYLLSLIDENYLAMKNNGAFEREKNRWPEDTLDLEDEYEYIRGWIQDRVTFLDTRYDYIPE